MAVLFEDSDIVLNARERGGGWNIVVEFIKFAIVIGVADKALCDLADYVVDNHIEPFETTGGIYLVCIGLMSVVAMFYCGVWERMTPWDIGVRLRPVLPGLRDSVVGYLLGIVCIGGSFLLANAFGAFETVPNFQNVIRWKIPWLFCVYLFQAFGEELMYRGAFMVSASRRSPAWLALLVTSASFSWQHHESLDYGPIAFANLLLFAVFCGITVFLTNRIWMATTAHAAWNLFQGNVFGIPVSGSTPNPQADLFLSMRVGSDLLTGGEMGLEGSVATTVVLTVMVALILAFYVWRSRRIRLEA